MHYKNLYTALSTVAKSRWPKSNIHRGRKTKNEYEYALACKNLLIWFLDETITDLIKSKED